MPSTLVCLLEPSDQRRTLPARQDAMAEEEASERDPEKPAWQIG